MEETSKPLQLPQIRPIRFLKSGMIELLRLRNFKLGFLVFNHGSRGDFPNSSRGYPGFPALSVLEYVNSIFKARFVGRRKPTAIGQRQDILMLAAGQKTKAEKRKDGCSLHIKG
jgi:hypothetical protein